MSNSTLPNIEALVTTVKNLALVDSRRLAVDLGTQHQSLFELLKDHQSDFESLGLLRFETGKVSGGRPERFALLDEDQAYLLLTYTRNSPTVRTLKLKLVLAFREARKLAELRQSEYLPTYRAVHDLLHMLSVGSSNETHVHCNVNRLLNKVAGIEAGQRAKSSLPQQSLLVVAQAVAAKALQRATDHRDGYQKVKAAVQPLGALLLLDGH
jgi:phage regulator Rha-like protein